MTMTETEVKKLITEFRKVKGSYMSVTYSDHSDKGEKPRSVLSSIYFSTHGENGSVTFYPLSEAPLTVAAILDELDRSARERMSETDKLKAEITALKAENERLKEGATTE